MGGAVLPARGGERCGGTRAGWAVRAGGAEVRRLVVRGGGGEVVEGRPAGRGYDVIRYRYYVTGYR